MQCYAVNLHNVDVYAIPYLYKKKSTLCQITIIDKSKFHSANFVQLVIKAVLRVIHAI